MSTPTFEECINVGRTAVEMPDLPLAPMQSSILACSTGPGMGLANLTMDSDNEQHYDRGGLALAHSPSLLHISPLYPSFFPCYVSIDKF